MSARVHVMRDRPAVLGVQSAALVTQEPVRVEAVVLKVNQQSARVRILGEDSQVTFRSGEVWGIVPGHLVTLVIERRWTWRGDAYASGKLENPRIDVAKIGLEPLPLDGGELDDTSAGRTCAMVEAGRRCRKARTRRRAGERIDRTIQLPEA